MRRLQPGKEMEEIINGGCSHPLSSTVCSVKDFRLGLVFFYSWVVDFWNIVALRSAHIINQPACQVQGVSTGICFLLLTSLKGHRNKVGHGFIVSRLQTVKLGRLALVLAVRFVQICLKLNRKF
jgi:hypothetical protein